MNFRKKIKRDDIIVTESGATKDFKRLDKVVYIPSHAHNNLSQANVEVGYVSSTNDKFVFVKFIKNLYRFDWSNVTAQACCPDDLIRIYDRNTEFRSIIMLRPLYRDECLKIIGQYGEIESSFWT